MKRDEQIPTPRGTLEWLKDDVKIPSPEHVAEKRPSARGKTHGIRRAASQEGRGTRRNFSSKLEPVSSSL